MRSWAPSRSPDHPGGGTVSWTNPWGEYQYWPDPETREDGGTPGVMQAVRAALCLKLKERMGIERMLRRERELTEVLLRQLESVPGLHILGGPGRNRLGIVSFVTESVHYNLMVKLLNDRFGIQVRGGCSCAGTYGHYLLGIDRASSRQIAGLIAAGDLSRKPGWVRVSLHPIITHREAAFIGAAVRRSRRISRSGNKTTSMNRERTNGGMFANSGRRLARNGSNSPGDRHIPPESA
ncbi:hypothetical protein HMSSN036_89180 [Paenibacillus macerans]|nr:hypothetical protein HMSSN036_89180 [Paenibacillus macerans]